MAVHIPAADAVSETWQDNTRTPYGLDFDFEFDFDFDFDGADGGENAHYVLRWVNPTGEKGPWSETATATIGA